MDFIVVYFSITIYSTVNYSSFFFHFYRKIALFCAEKAFLRNNSESFSAYSPYLLEKEVT